MTATDQDERSLGALKAPVHPSSDRATGHPVQGAVNGGLTQPGGWTLSPSQPCATQQGSGGPRPAHVQPAGPARPAAPHSAAAAQPGHTVPSARALAGRATLPAWQQLPDPAFTAEHARAAAHPAAAAPASGPRPQTAAPAQPQQALSAPSPTAAGGQASGPTSAAGLNLRASFYASWWRFASVEVLSIPACQPVA